jgi:hypothetical protein
MAIGLAGMPLYQKQGRDRLELSVFPRIHYPSLVGEFEQTGMFAFDGRDAEMQMFWLQRG